VLFSPQIPLPLEPSRPDRFEDFVAGPNEGVVQALRQLLEQAGGSLFLSGPGGSGKTHLLNAVCHAARENGQVAFYLSLRRSPDRADARLRGLQGMSLVCVDDLDCVAGEAEWEQALFRCFNDLHQAGGRLVVSSRAALSSLPLGLPDLKSRLAWGLRLKLAPLGDEHKLQILQNRMRALGVELPGDVQAYLIKHGRRDTGSLLSALEKLKQAAFVAKRRITVPLAREILGQSGQQAPPGGASHA
jgi:DnaA family protein